MPIWLKEHWLLESLADKATLQTHIIIIIYTIEFIIWRDLNGNCSAITDFGKLLCLTLDLLYIQVEIVMK